jgi:FtsZ-binding cell division protein ZapB
MLTVAKHNNARDVDIHTLKTKVTELQDKETKSENDINKIKETVDTLQSEVEALKKTVATHGNQISSIVGFLVDGTKLLIDPSFRPEPKPFISNLNRLGANYSHLPLPKRIPKGKDTRPPENENVD